MVRSIDRDVRATQHGSVCEIVVGRRLHAIEVQDEWAFLRSVACYTKGMFDPTTHAEKPAQIRSAIGNAMNGCQVGQGRSPENADVVNVSGSGRDQINSFFGRRPPPPDRPAQQWVNTRPLVQLG